MATKQHRLQARGLIENLESRLHTGTPIQDHELAAASTFLQQSAFSAASDYHERLRRLRHQLAARAKVPPAPNGKRNYGGQADGIWMQVQSAYDHLIISTCYAGQVHLKRGRVKVSQRFNQAGRIDFVELKFVSALQACLNGEVRKLLLVKDYQTIDKHWHSAEAFVLPVLPKELIFLYAELFRLPREELHAWLINIGHSILSHLQAALLARAVPEDQPQSRTPQLPLGSLLDDPVAAPILSQAALIKSSTQLLEPGRILVRYHD